MGSTVEDALATAEGRALEEAEPGLASEGGTHEPHGIIQWNAEEDLLAKHVWQCRRSGRWRSLEFQLGKSWR
jgi:hypothetical protein